MLKVLERVKPLEDELDVLNGKMDETMKHYHACCHELNILDNKVLINVIRIVIWY